MYFNLGQKSLDCLKLAELREIYDWKAWTKAYNSLCTKYSEKAVIKKMEQLANKGYINYGITARTGWLTDKGREVLREVNNEF